MQKFSYLSNSNAAYIDELFAIYSQNPESIDPSWRYFFEGLELGEDAPPQKAEQPSSTSSTPVPVSSGTSLYIEAQVAELIQTFRSLGKLIANLDPLTPPPSQHPLLELSQFGLTSADLSKTFQAGKLIGIGAATLQQIIDHLKQIYCRNVGFEISYIQNPEERNWLQQKIESKQAQQKLNPETQKRILERLTASESFERFLHTRYVAQKRFSIEGAESLIPAIDCMIDTAADSGTEEFVLGMAHRGRLNVLTNVLHKKHEHIFTEFEGAYKPDLSKGESDVKYHMGHSHDVVASNGKKVHLSLAFNPSHLEFINAVIEGMTRAKQTQKKDEDRSKVIPLSIHGDAAFAGQGVCYETLNLSQLKGYKTGGTVHVVINNQVGFTTSPFDSRSTSYCTDIAKMLDAPIFHVNGDDPEAMWNISKLCIEYRQKFKKDIFIDLICYRKHGHNEGDEPLFTQPLLYKKIKSHASTREIYSNQLIKSGVLSAEESQKMVDDFTAKLSEAQTRTKAEQPTPLVPSMEDCWAKLKRPSDEDLFKPIKTSVTAETLIQAAKQLNTLPSGFNLQSKLQRFIEQRLKAIETGEGIDWGNGETLAYATLLLEGTPVRLSGQDVERGTFSHRHSVLNDTETGEKYTPLNHLKDQKAFYSAHNSHLSETGVLGFEYGYSISDPDTLVIWEAQFGDFSNGGQVIIDQFIATSESKWQRMTGLTLLLPHGYEGQGPEHSSARLERFLQLAGRNNISVCNLTTPAQIFHALRRQVKRDFRKPLVIMSPKSLLRHPLAISKLDELTHGSFQEVIDDSTFSEKKVQSSVKKVILCTGKVYYDLLQQRNARKAQDVAIVRIEQLYPWPEAQLAKILNRYPQATFVWVQEEPRNMGAWGYIFNTWCGGLDLFQDQVGGRTIQYVGREIASSPAVGSHKVHEKQQESLIQKAFL